MERPSKINVLTRIGAAAGAATAAFGLARSIAVPPVDGNCMVGQICPRNGDMSNVNWPIVSYENSCELYPTYTEAALKVLNQRRSEQGLSELPGKAYNPDAKPGEDGYLDLNKPIGECGAPEIHGYKLIGWYGDESDIFPLYDKVSPQDSK